MNRHAERRLKERRELLKGLHGCTTFCDSGECYSPCMSKIPTADVVPRAEVAREIFAEIEREITDALKSNYKVLPQVEESEALWNNVNGKINALRGIEYFIAELKEKYTEGQNDEKV